MMKCSLWSLLGTWNVASVAEKLDLKFYLILNGHMWLVAMILEASERWWYPLEKRTVSVSETGGIYSRFWSWTVEEPGCHMLKSQALVTRDAPPSPHPLSWLFISFQTGSESIFLPSPLSKSLFFPSSIINAVTVEQCFVTGHHALCSGDVAWSCIV